MIQRVFSNPIAMEVFSRLTGIEKRIQIASEAFSPVKKTAGGTYEGDESGRVHEDATRHKLLTDWIASVTEASVTPITGPEVSDEDLTKLNAIEKPVRAQNVVRPVFEDESFVFTDEIAVELLKKVEAFDPTPEMVVTELPEGSDPGD